MGRSMPKRPQIIMQDSSEVDPKIKGLKPLQVTRIAAETLADALDSLSAKDEKLVNQTKEWFADRKSNKVFSYSWCLEYSKMPPGLIKKFYDIILSGKATYKQIKTNKVDINRLIAELEVEKLQRQRGDNL